MSDPMIFSVTTLAPGPANFVFDDIGFGPISGTLAVNEELLGIPLPLIDAGVTIGYELGARLVLKGGFGTPTVNINYALTEGALINQSSTALFPDNDAFQQRLAQQSGIYSNRAIVFDTGTIGFVDTGNAMLVTGSDKGAFLSLDLEYKLKLDLINAFVDLGFPIYEGETFAINETLLDLEGRFNFFDLKEGKTLAEITQKSDPFFGTFLKVPITPKFENSADYTVNGLANGLTSVSVYDTGDPFAQLKVDFAKVLAKAGVPVGFDLDLGFGGASLNLLSAVGYANASMGQRETFRADDVHVRLELFSFDGVSTGKVVEGRLGDELMFDSLTIPNFSDSDPDIGFGTIKATYTLYGALEQETGLELAAGINLGLLTGAVHVDVFGFTADGSFGPLIQLPAIEFNSGLIPLVSDSKAIVFDSITREYAIYSQKDAEGTNGDDTPILIPPQKDFSGFGGNDYVRASNIIVNTIHGDEGNDLILGSDVQTDPDAVDAGDKLFGGTGDDILVGGEGNDELHAGFGLDLLMAGEGDDYLTTVGTDGADVLDGGAGFDKAFIDRQGSTIDWAAPAPASGFFNLGSVTGVDGVLPDGTVVRGIEQWQLMLGFGNDAVRGGQYDDVINGGAGADSLDGGAGFDIIRGEGGNDFLRWQQPVVQGWADQVSGGVGLDTVNIFVSESQDVAFNLSGQALLLPNAQGGIGVWSDLSGSIDGIKLDADSGDFFALLIGNFDSFGSATKVDFLNTALHPELVLKVRTDIEQLSFVQTGSGRVFVTGGYLADSITSGDGNDRLDGLLGADSIFAYGGDDLVINWDADTMLDGGSGDDTLSVIRSGATAKALVIDFLAKNAAGFGETSDGALFTEFEHLKVEGSQHGDIIKGGTKADTIYGNGGKDMIEGRGGGDMIDAGAGDDTVTASEGIATGVNHYDGGDGMDTLLLDWGVGAIVPIGLSDFSFISDPLTIDFSAAGPVDMGNGSTLVNFERIIVNAGNAADTIKGGFGVVETAQRGGTPLKVGDVIDAGAGNDTITTSGLYDVVAAGDGDDTVFTGIGSLAKLDGGDGFDTLIIHVPYSLDQSKITAKFKTYSYTTPEGAVRSATVQELKLPDGTIISNFEQIIFDVESLTDQINESLSRIDDVLVSGAIGRVNGGLGNDRIGVQIAEPNPRPDPLGPIAELIGGGGDDVMQANTRATMVGGEGFDRAEFNFGHLLDSITGNFKGGTVTLNDAAGNRFSKASGIEQAQVGLGAGNDFGTFEAGDFEVDFGEGIDSVLLKDGKQLEGKTYGFGGGIVPTFRVVTDFAESLIDTGGPRRSGFSDSTGRNLSNFENLELFAGQGSDLIDLTYASPLMLSIKADGGGGADTIYGSLLAETLLGGAGEDTILAGGGDDRVEGGSEDDVIDGSYGADTLLGGDGDDELTGGGEADLFVFDTTALGDFDVILDFNAAEGDVIDLSRIDAVARRAGNQAFTLIGGEPFGNVAGQLRIGNGFDGVVIEGDVDGDGLADFAIELTGVEELDRGALIL